MEENTQGQEPVQEQIPAQETAPTPEGTSQPVSPKKSGNMKKRAITGILYVLVLLAFFALKLFVWVPAERLGDGSGLRVGMLFFDLLIVAFGVVGTWEMLRAFKDKLHGSQKTIVTIFSILVVVTYAVSDFVFADVFGIRLPEETGIDGIVSMVRGRNYSLHITFVVFMAGICALFGLLVFAHEKVSLESTGCALLSYIYPSFFLLVLSVCNHLEKYSELALRFVFVICPCADTFAFIFGKSFGKKLPAKMAPHVSPKKTIIGGFGGLLGGAIGAVIIFFASYGISLLDDAGIVASLRWDLSIDAPNIIFYIALGILTSAFSQFGDLVESAIKRKVGIKDMGKILPGHGGILDRIDSALYAGPIVCVVMVVRIMIFH